MNEFELFETYLQILNELYETDSRIYFYPGDDKLNMKRNSLLIEKLNLASQLETTRDKSFSKSAHERMIKQLGVIISEINSVDPQLRIDRNQGLILKNYVFSKVYQYLDSQILFPVGGVFMHLLYYSNNFESSIAKEDFIKFIESEISILSSMKEINYVVLKAFLDTFFIRVNESGLLN